MRVQRLKAFRKTLLFYKLTFGLVTPYRILLDGNFLATCLRLKFEWARLLPAALHTSTSHMHYHVTQCVMHELEALGEPGRAALALARTLPLLKCRDNHGHGVDCSPAQCARALVGRDNAGKWMVVSQDPELRDALRHIPGVPLCLLSSNVLILEEASAASKAFRKNAERRKAALGAAEAAAVSASMAGGQKGGGARGLLRKKKKRAGGPSEPNPLSKKKSKRPREEGRGREGGGEGGEGAKNRRKKQRVGGEGGE